MTIGHILLSAAFFAIPVLLKYFLAFETRTLVESLRSREEEVRRLSVRWQALERERLVMRGAVKQVAMQKRHAATRRERLEDMHRRLAEDYEPYLDDFQGEENQGVAASGNETGSMPSQVVAAS